MASGNHLHNLGSELLRLEREDPEVAAARASYDRMVDRIVGRSPGLSSEELRAIYDPPCEAD